MTVSRSKLRRNHQNNAQELCKGLCPYLGLAITVDDIQFPGFLAAEIWEHGYKMTANLPKIRYIIATIAKWSTDVSDSRQA
jgi:hypothetical protein